MASITPGLPSNWHEYTNPDGTCYCKCADHDAQCSSGIATALQVVFPGTPCFTTESGQGTLILAVESQRSGYNSESQSYAPTSTNKLGPLPTPSQDYASATPTPSDFSLVSASPDIPHPCTHQPDGFYCGVDQNEASYRLAIYNLTGPAPSPCYQHFYYCSAAVMSPFQAVPGGTLRLCYTHTTRIQVHRGA